jgi:DNA-binding NtrC family response regulator
LPRRIHANGCGAAPWKIDYEDHPHERENAYLQQAVQVRASQGLTSHSPAFRSVIEQAAQVAQTRSTVLLLGETGSGKEVRGGFAFGP